MFRNLGHVLGYTAAVLALACICDARMHTLLVSRMQPLGNATTLTSAKEGKIKKGMTGLAYLNGLILDSHSNFACNLLTTSLAALETEPGINHTVVNLGGLEAYLAQESLGWLGWINVVSTRVIYGYRDLLVGPDNIAILLLG